MVRILDYAGPVIPPKSKKQAAGKKRRKEVETGEGSAPPVESGFSAMLPAPPSTEDCPTMPTLLPIVPAGAGRAGEEEEEEEEEVPLLKRRRLVRLADLPSGPSSRKKEDKRKGGKGGGSKEKVVTESADKWESAISLAKTASIGDLDVSLHLAEKVTPPTDEEFVGSFSDMELAPRLVRSCMRGLVMAFEAYRRIEQLDAVNRSQGQEALDLAERVKTLGDELSETKEERDLFRAKLSSLEEERKSWEEARSVLQAQIATGEEERRRSVAEKDQLVEEGEGLKKEMMVVRERSEKYLQDCRAAVEGRCRAEDALKESQCSVKQQRIEAIKRWKRRNLNAECLELACDVTLSVLKKCHEVHVPAGSERPSFEDYAEPLLPALGLSLEGMKEKAEGERSGVPDEELDRSSEEEEEDVSPLSSPPNPIVGPSLPLADPAVDPSSADPVVGPSSPRGGSE